MRKRRATIAKLLDYNAELVRRDDYTPELTVFHVRLDEPLSSGFLPGQYVALGLNNEENVELGSVRRSMSIASAPKQGEVLEFYIRFVRHPESDNPLTHLLWKMKKGDRIFVTRKPVGKFTVAGTCGIDIERMKVCVAAGTGLAPFLSMVREEVLLDPGVDLSDYLLLHGASYPSDLIFREELEGYAKSNKLHYFPTVSRPKETPDWKGFSGRVEDFFVPDRLAELESAIGVEPGWIRPERAAVLVCGLNGTIAKSIERLAERGFVPFDRKIRRALDISDDAAAGMWWEQYDTEPVIDVNNPELLADLKSKLSAAAPAVAAVAERR